MTHEEMVNAIQDVADDVNGTVRHDYSGRGMYGAKCYGIVCDDSTECIEEASAAGLRGARVDNMGLDYIVYWEHVKGVDTV